MREENLVSYVRYSRDLLSNHINLETGNHLIRWLYLYLCKHVFFYLFIFLGLIRFSVSGASSHKRPAIPYTASGRLRRSYGFAVTVMHFSCTRASTVFTGTMLVITVQVLLCVATEAGLQNEVSCCVSNGTVTVAHKGQVTHCTISG